MSTLAVTVASFGGAALVAAAVGGGLSGAGLNIPVLSTSRQQILTGIVGAVLLALGIYLNTETRFVDRKIRLDPANRTEESDGVVFCYWNITPYSPPGKQTEDLASGYDEENRDLKLKVGIYNAGSSGESCDELGPHYHLLRQGETVPLRHPRCRLTVTATHLHRGLKQGHTWDEYFEAGRKGVDRSSWYDAWAELRIAGECPVGGAAGTGEMSTAQSQDVQANQHRVESTATDGDAKGTEGRASEPPIPSVTTSPAPRPQSPVPQVIRSKHHLSTTTDANQAVSATRGEAKGQVTSSRICSGNVTVSNMNSPGQAAICIENH